MKALLWKEFHENLKWAAIPLLLMLGYVLNFGVCLCDTFFLRVSFVSAVFGSVLGILQMTFESHGDRRALLLHRPISRTHLFLAKVASGSTLYLLAVGLPLLFYLVKDFIPGGVVPQLPLSSRWPLVFPWFADALTGLIYYLAGALAGLRPGRWYGTRCLGFPVAFLATFLAWNLAEFHEVLIALLLLASVMGLAAWGSFLTAGDTDSQPRLAKFGLACTFLIGLSILSLWGKSTFESWTLRSTDDDYYAYHQINSDGRILIVEQLGRKHMHVRDLAGHEWEEYRNNTLREAQLSLLRIRASSAPAHSEAMHTRGRSYRTISRYLVPVSAESMPANESWCFVPQLGQLVGYDNAKREPIGRIGPEGFVPAGETPQTRFQGPMDYSPIRTNPDYLVFPGGVYSVDFQQRRLLTIFTPEAGEIVHGARDWRDDLQGTTLSIDRESIQGVETYRRSDTEDPGQIVVGTNRAIYLLDQQGNRELVFPVKHDTRQYMMSLNRFEAPDRYAVHYSPSYFLGMISRQTMESHVIEYSNDGHELSDTTLPALPWQRGISYQPWFGGLTSPAEAAVFFVSTKDFLFRTRFSRQHIGSKFQYTFLEQLYRILPWGLDLSGGLSNSRLRLYVLGLAINALLGAVICFWLSRRFGITGMPMMLWLVCGLLFGLVGGLMMACIHEWPARISCPKCNKRRLVTRENCEHCGAPHAAPPTDGTEVFATTVVTS
ncbi:MAG: hypothetical protein KDA86_19100 [Planctomycetaceae bacterium]|nr:hypothetical protein [Planctomycetaceae bacterium]